MADATVIITFCLAKDERLHVHAQFTHQDKFACLATFDATLVSDLSARMLVGQAIGELIKRSFAEDSVKCEVSEIHEAPAGHA